MAAVALEQPTPLSMVGNVAENWVKFKRRFEIYITATGKKKEKDQAKLIAIFCHIAGDEAVEFLSTVPEGDQKTLKDVLRVFDDYCNPRKNVTVERYKFNSAYQGSDESIQTFVTRLKILATTCDFGDIKNELIRDRIIVGIKDDNLRRKLLSIKELTLENAVDVLLASIAAKEGNKTVKPENSHVKEEVDIDWVANSKGRGGYNKNGNQYQNTQQTSQRDVFYRPGNRGRGNFRRFQQQTDRVNYRQQTDARCTKCGLTHGNDSCPAREQLCYHCNRVGHYSRRCFFKSQQVASLELDEEKPDTHDDSDLVLDGLDLWTVQIENVDVTDSDSSTDWTTTLVFNNIGIKFKLDTGAQGNVISYNDFCKIPNKPPPNYTEDRLVAYSGNVIPHQGKVTLLTKCNGAMYTAEFFVVPGGGRCILGKSDCVKFGLITRIAEVSQVLPPKCPTSIYPSYSLDAPQYQELFKGLGCVPGKHEIRMKTGVAPVVHPCRKVPFPMLEKVKAELKRMEDLGVIVPVNEPTEWVNSMVTVPKKNGTIRLCMDPRDLNRGIQRQHFKLPTREEIMAKFSGAVLFSKLDAANGFWQIELEEESQKLCTFNTPFGRYKYTRLPFGLCSAPEVYHKTVNHMFEGLSNVDTSMDDIILWGKTKEEHDYILQKVMQTCKDKNLKLNKSKCELGVKELVFLGDLITSEGIKPDKRKVSAIINMERPKNKTDVQRFLGMVTYLAKWIPELSKKSAPLRDLLVEKNDWQWTEKQEDSWNLLKATVSSHPVLEFYDPTLPTKISTDASRDGLGATLLQLHGDDWKPVSYASRRLSNAEQQYAQIEKELLSICFGCQRFHQFIYGNTVEAETDHKPLVSLFKKSLVDCPLRIQKMMLRLQKYDLSVHYIPGKQLVIADTLSRAIDVTEVAAPEKEELIYMDAVMEVLPITEEQQRKIRAETLNDPTLKELLDVVQNGWPKAKSKCPHAIRSYWSIQDELSSWNGFLFKGLRLLIPQGLRKEILHKIHTGHMGIVKCQKRARESVYWPGLTKDIKEMVERCETCIKFSPAQQKEKLVQHDTPSYPWQKIGADIFQIKNKNYLVIADYLSCYPEVMTLPQSMTSTSVQEALKSVFARHGTPEVVFTDNGSQFTSEEFANFATDWEFKHETSSPYFPQSNGLAESSVKTAKFLIMKAVDSKQDVYKALQAYRATPIMDGLSPAEILMGRKIRADLPLHPDTLVKPWMSEIITKKQEIKQHQKIYHDKTAKNLAALKKDQNVRIRDSRTGRWEEEAVVVRMVDGRSYELELLDGRRVRRNRLHIKPIPQCPPKTPLQPNPNIPVIQPPSQRVLNPSQQSVPKRQSLRIRRPPDRWTS